MHHDRRFWDLWAAPSDCRWDSASRDSSIPAGVSPNPIPCRKGLSLRFFWCGLICFDRWYGIMRLMWKWYLDIIQLRNGLKPGIGDFDFASRMERAERVQPLDLSHLSLRPRTYDQRLSNKNRIYRFTWNKLAIYHDIPILNMENLPVKDGFPLVIWDIVGNPQLQIAIASIDTKSSTTGWFLVVISYQMSGGYSV